MNTLHLNSCFLRLRLRVLTIVGLLTLALVLIPSGASTQGSLPAVVATDKLDYLPGEVALISGSGWQAGETVSLLLRRSPQTQPDSTLSAVANSEGAFTNVRYIVTEQDRGVVFTLTGLGESSGRTAQTRFTDGISGRADLPNTISSNLDDASPSTLATAIAGTGISNIANVTYIGYGGSSGTFSNGTQDIGLDSGIFLDTSFGPSGPSGDSQLSNILATTMPPGVLQVMGSATNSATVLEFDFVPNGSTVKFEYVFASYDHYAWNDIFGFFINGQPAGYSSVDSTFGPEAPPPIAFKKSAIITAQFSVQSGVVNRLKLAIADHNDTAIDTFAFISAGSLSVVNAPPVAQASASATVECPGSVTLDATGSTDPDGDTLTAVWKEGSTELGTGLLLNINLPLGQHAITLTVSDPSGGSSTSNVTVDVVDSTAPTISAPAAVNISADASSCSAYVSDAALGSATANDGCSTVDVTRTGVPAGNRFPIGQTQVMYTATDNSGNATSSTQIVTVVDRTEPAITVPADITTFLPLNSSATTARVTFAVSASDNCGAATTTASPASNSNFPVGTTTVNVTSTDTAGNISRASFRVTVRYNFTGFFWPVYNLPVVNKTRAGYPVPLIFKLSGNKGLNIFAAGSPSSGVIACNSTDPVVDTAETNTYPRLGLLYEPRLDIYVYVWKTETSWRGQCRQVVVQLKDGTTYRANFKFR